MVAMEVAMAILTERSGLTPRCDKMKVMNGTINMPPPMPSRPAKKPVPKPSRASGKTKAGSKVMEEGGEVRCLQSHRARIPSILNLG